MIAILSDIHANIEALTAVYDDLTKRGIKRVFFLGDIVGYGPNPGEVLDFIKNFEFCLLGNHDQACLRGPPRAFNPSAQRAAWWTRSQVCPEEMSNALFHPTLYQRRKDQWEFLQGLKPMRTMGQMMFVHDTPSDPGSWRYVRSHEEADKGFKKNPKMRAFFMGHSHQPGIWTETGYIVPEPGRKFDFRKRVMVNVGSVGQPRDKDTRASYVMLEADGFRFFRVPYDLEKTQEKIRENPELDNQLADRLSKGE